jgi:hypothetical protein
MNAIKDAAMRVAKRSKVLSWVAGSPVGELFDTKQPFSYRLMRITSRSNILRNAAVHFYAARMRREPLRTSHRSLFKDLVVPRFVETLTARGFAGGLVLPADCLSDILNFCGKAQFVPDRDPRVPILINPTDEANPRPDNVFYRCLNPHTQCKTVDELACDPFVIDVSRRYLKTEPVFLSSQIWWSYPYPAKYDCYTPEYGFHYDIDDYKFLKLFVYLNCVDEARGPHVIVERTHKRKDFFEKRNRRLTDEQVAIRYPGAMRVMTGQRGEGFFEDTFCYHKGTNPRKRRLTLQLEYGIRSSRRS